MLFAILLRSLNNLTLPGILKMLLWCLIAYVIGWSLLSWGIAALISAYGSDIPEIGSFSLRLLSGVGGAMLAWFLFPLLYPILVGFFDDYMAEAIERENYPQLAPAQPPFWPTLMQDALFSLKAIALNILCLPIYFVPLVGMAVYYGMNGYLLGMQFFRMAAGRRAGKAEVAAMQRSARKSILSLGVLVSVCATIPLLNLVAPLLGVALMLHLFHALRGTDMQKILPPA